MTDTYHDILHMNTTIRINLFYIGCNRFKFKWSFSSILTIYVIFNFLNG